MRPLSLALLGPFRARLGDGRALRIRRRKSRALLAYLALQPDEPQPREKLMALLWTEADPDRARHSLRQTLTALRQDLAPLGWADAVLAGDALCLDPRLLRVDVADFERLARGPDLHRLERAAAAYRGDFLEGLVTGEDTFETWLAAERDRLRGEALGVLDRLVTVHVAAGAPAEAARAATRLLALDPLREDVHRLLMRLYARAGRRNAALRQYRACADVLGRDLGVAPEEETIDLYRALLARPTSSAADEARRHCLAADGAALRSDFHEAARCLDRALASIAETPAGRARLAWETDVRLGFERALVPLGESAVLLAHLEAAEAGALALGDRRRLGWVAAHRMSYDFLEGDARAAVARAGTALEIAAATGDDALAAAARHRLAQAYYWQGDFPRCAALAGQLTVERPGELSLIDSVQGVVPAVHCRAYLALALSALGDFAGGRAAAREGLRLAERSGHEWTVAFARSSLGVSELQSGRPREACESFAVARELQSPSGGAPRFMLPGQAMGSALGHLGRREEGLKLVEAAVRVAPPRGLGPVRPQGLTTLARFRLQEGRVAEARAHVEEALRLVRACGQRAGEAWALQVLAEVLARAEATRLTRRPRAAAVCLDALARAEALGMRPLAARCQATLGELWERSGDLERARRARAAAADLCHELGLVAAGAITEAAAVRGAR
jgi:DNA-binding SARP family transcriptional activator